MKKYFIFLSLFYFLIIFYNLANQGLIQVDEGYYLSVIHTFSSILRTIFSHPFSLFSSDYYSDLIYHYGAVSTVAKPIFILSSAPIDSFYRSNLSAVLVNILAGFFSLILFYKILGYYFGSISHFLKLFSVILFFLSPLFLIYTRVSIPVMLATCFSLLALFYLLKFHKEGNKKPLFLVGIFSSLIFMSHYSTVYLVIVFLLIGLFLLFKLKAPAKNYFYYIFSFIIIPFIWEIITRIGLFIAKTKNIFILTKDKQIFSYFQEILFQIKQSNFSDGLTFNNFSSYLQLFFFSEGFVITLFLTAGFIIMIKNIYQPRFLFIFLLLIFPLTMLSLAQIKVTRVLIPLLPLFYLLVSLGIIRIISVLIGKYNFKIVLIFFILLLSIIFLPRFNDYYNIFHLSSEFKKVAHFITQQYRPDEVVIYSPTASILRAYLFNSDYRILGMDDFENNKIGQNKNKKIIAIIGYFYKEDYKYIERYPLKLLKEYPTNIFKVKQIVGDTNLNNLFKRNLNPEDYKISIFDLEI